MTPGCVVFWFRRDLRWRDNVGLYHAFKSKSPVLPVFVFDRDILTDLQEDDRRVRFIWETLMEMDQRLHDEFGTHIRILYGRPSDCFERLISDYTVRAVYFNRDYEPYALSRDEEVRRLMSARGITVHDFKDQVIFERDEITKDDGNPYVVYTPYKNKWKQAFSPTTDLISYEVPREERRFVQGVPRTDLSLERMGFNVPRVQWPQYTLKPEVISGYEQTREFPAAHRGTSRIGLHLRFGLLSIREVIRNIRDIENPTYWHELIWREFFMQILWAFPHTVQSSFKPAYDRIPWRNDPGEFERWKTGTTGYPLVDAGMRELRQTGYMHNRVRMLASSFLCKHLLIDWRLGEGWFAAQLLDYELASNVGNWQWAAGSGVDAAPYFRIFNPETQIKKFDKQHEYIQTWVPEYQSESYPKPVVDHKEARERCLRVYKEALK